MEFKQLKQLSALPQQELTAKLIGLFGEILGYHDSDKGMSPFDWRCLLVSDCGRLVLSGISETALTDDVRQRNYYDYAAVIYCVCTGQKSAESMSWDAGRRIKQPVLREIVLTFCGRNASIDPLIDKLREPYVDEDSFFNGYSTVDEKEASEAFAKSERIKWQNALDDAAHARPVPAGAPWYKGIGVFLLMAVCVGGYKAYKANERHKQGVAFEQSLKSIDVRLRHMEYIRGLPPAKLKIKTVGQDAPDEDSDQ